MSDVRKVTNAVYDLMEFGELEWKTWALETLRYLSEDQVAEIAHTLELFPDEDEEDEDSDEDEDDL